VTGPSGSKRVTKTPGAAVTIWHGADRNQQAGGRSGLEALCGPSRQVPGVRELLSLLDMGLPGSSIWVGWAGSFPVCRAEGQNSIPHCG
jgi:hypothetical protein